MPQVVEEIPPELRPEVEAALAFINSRHGRDFRVTGIISPEEALAHRADAGADGFELSLVLCQGDLCANERVRVRREGRDIRCALPAAAPNSDVPAHLDPPAGTRKGWLDARLAKHAFIVLLFYRGFW